MISGVDEAGRGPVIGPLVIAGVTFKDDTQLINMNVRDSKKITPKRRQFLANQIKKLALKYEILVITAKDIDDMRKVMTLNEIEVNAFTSVIKKLKPETCYVDSADVNEERFGKDISSNLTFKTEIISKHKADDIYPIVGAASILAKTKRDKEVEKISQILREKLDMPLGSGYPADPVTQKFLKTWVDRYGKFPIYVRYSWKTAQKLLKEKDIKKLDDF
jgi:ribonuclease HII